MTAYPILIFMQSLIKFQSVVSEISPLVSPLVLTFSSIIKAAVTVNESFELSYQVTTHRIMTTCSNVSDRNFVHIWTLMKLFITSRGTVMELDTVSAQTKTMFITSRGTSFGLWTLFRPSPGLCLMSRGTQTKTLFYFDKTKVLKF